MQVVVDLVIFYPYPVSQLLDVSRDLRGCGQSNDGCGEGSVEATLSWGEFCVCSVELYELMNRQQNKQDTRPT